LSRGAGRLRASYENGDIISYYSANTEWCPSASLLLQPSAPASVKSFRGQIQVQDSSSSTVVEFSRQSATLQSKILGFEIRSRQDVLHLGRQFCNVKAESRQITRQFYRTAEAQASTFSTNPWPAWPWAAAELHRRIASIVIDLTVHFGSGCSHLARLYIKSKPHDRPNCARGTYVYALIFKRAAHRCRPSIIGPCSTCVSTWPRPSTGQLVDCIQLNHCN
jgi:hypothetical protein